MTLLNIMNPTDWANQNLSGGVLRRRGVIDGVSCITYRGDVEAGCMAQGYVEVA
jgi:hypothetical protein